MPWIDDDQITRARFFFEFVRYHIDIGQGLMRAFPQGERQKQQSGDGKKHPRDLDPPKVRQHSAD